MTKEIVTGKMFVFANVGEDEAYNDIIKNICNTVYDTQNNILQMYWDIGDSIYSFVMTMPDKNISEALRNIAQHVKEASNGRLNELSDDSLRKALKIRESFSEVQLQLAKEGCVSLRNLIPMCNNDVTDDERDKYLNEVVEGKIDQTELPEKVAEDHPQDTKIEQRGGARAKKEAPLGFMSRIVKDIDKLMSDMDTDWSIHMATILGGKDETAEEEYSRQFETISNQMETLARVWGVNLLATKEHAESFKEQLTA